MMAELLLEIITPYRSVFNGPIKSITVPGTEGSFQVLVNHAPIIAALEIGEIKVRMPDDSIIEFATGGGTIEVLNNKVLVLADSLEKPEEINIERVKSALQRAKDRLEKREKTTDLNRAEAALRRAINRLKFVEKKIRSEV